MKLYFAAKLFFLIIFLILIKGYSQNLPSLENPQSLYKDAGRRSQNKALLLSAGVNISSYLFEESKRQLGYRLGLTFNFIVHKKLSITLPCSYTRINTAVKNVQGRFYSFDDYFIYRKLTDWQISVGFLEFPVLLCYKFCTSKKYNLSFTFGPGLVIAAKDFSTKENVTITDEIIGTHDGPPIDPIETQFTISNSGFNLNAGIRFNINRFYLDFMYTFYPYIIKEINKLYTISLIFSIDLG